MVVETYLQVHIFENLGLNILFVKFSGTGMLWWFFHMPVLYSSSNNIFN